MNPRNHFIMLALAGSVAVGCGSNNDDNNANATTNGATNGATNGMTNGMTNGATNGMTNGATNGMTNNNTNTYTPFEFMMCPNTITPAGALADAVGTWDIGAGCEGENFFGLLDALCADGVITNVAYENYAGRMVVNADGSFALAVANTFAADVYVPPACVSGLAPDGTCDGLAGFVDGATGRTVTTCVDEGNGDCLCTLTGDGGVRDFGTIAEGANAGEFTATSLKLQDDGSYIEVVRNLEIQTDGATIAQRDTATTSSLGGAMSAMAASDCEFYCHGFMALCNDNENVTAYTDTTDCLTQCAGFAPGTPADMAGATLGCRMYHLGVAGDSSDVANPDTHCVHAQAAPTAVCM